MVLESAICSVLSGNICIFFSFLRSLLSAINQQLRKRQEEEMVFSQKMARATKDQDENNIDEKVGDPGRNL